MNPSEHKEATKTGQALKPTRPQPKSGRGLSLVHGNDERSLHLSPILQQIKDDGPALIDGEVVKEGAVTPKLAKSLGANDAKPAPAAAVASTQALLAGKQSKVLVAFCAALAVGLCASLYFSWQQQQRLANVEYLLEVLVTTAR